MAGFGWNRLNVPAAVCRRSWTWKPGDVTSVG
jgi:hypothetical protein